MQDYLVELKHISKFFPGVKALNDVSLNIRRKTIHCIIGENGAGKSTLMKIMSGAYQKDKGTILIEGKELNASGPAEALKAGIGIVYQELNNFGYMDVASNLFIGRMPRKYGMIDYKKLYRDAQELLDRFNMSYIKPTDVMNRLSLGSQQMVEIAKLLSMNVKLMILDEPTSALTDTEVELLYQLIAQVKERGVSFVYISHKLDEILHLADDITVLKDGEFVDSFPNSSDLTKDDLVRLMVGRDVAYDYGAGTTEIKEEIMKVRSEQVQLMKRRGGVGYDLSKLRPRGSKVNNSAKTSTGAASFMQVNSDITNEVAQNGRRGALMLTMSINHPDIEEFITKKQDLTKVTGANISVKVNDEFMNAVEENKDYFLRWPVDFNLDPSMTKSIEEYDKLVAIGEALKPDKRVYLKKVKAKRLWNILMHCAWNTAEPGIIFETRMHDYAPDGVYDEFKMVSTNPCLTGETKVLVADGRGWVEIEQLVKEGKDIPVFCLNNRVKIEVQTMRNPRVTGYNEKIYKVTLEGGHVIRCTGNHKFLTIDGIYKEFKDIIP